MRYAKKPKYKLDKSKIKPPKEEKASAKDIYEEMLRDKIRKRKR
jgi:hypothetical protein